MPPSVQPSARIGEKTLRRLIWLYFWLLIFEGALRRWILPGFAGPLLVIREPVALAIIGLAWYRGFLHFSWPLVVCVVAGCVSFGAALLVGHGNWIVAAFGLRIFLVHLPILFIVPRVFDAEDVARVGKAVCWLGLVMTPLIAAQFFLPQSHFVNIGVAGEGTAGFAGAGGRFRPPGTFSFTTGLASFYSLYAAIVAAFALSVQRMKAWWWLSVIALVVAIPLTVSRTVLFSVGITVILFVVAGIGNSRLVRRFAIGCVILGALAPLGMLNTAFREGMVAFSNRWINANEAEGGLLGVVFDRFLGGLLSAFSATGNVPPLGYGLGMGTNAGSSLMTGERQFLIAEGEWARLVGEMGLTLGVLVIFCRVAIAFFLLKVGFSAWRRGRPMALLLGSVTVIWIVQGNWAQPTSLGFAVLGGGLTAAAARPPRLENSKRMRMVTGTVEQGVPASQ